MPKRKGAQHKGLSRPEQRARQRNGKAARQLRVARRMLELGDGFCQEAMAKEEGVHKATICRDVEQIQAQWGQEKNKLRSKAVDRVRRKIATLENAAWLGFEETGDNKFLLTLVRLLQRECKILGLEVTKQRPPEPSGDAAGSQVTNNNQLNINVDGTLQLTDPRLLAIVAALSQRSGEARDQPDLVGHDELPGVPVPAAD